MDAKDILGLPKNALPLQERKSKPPKESQRKPEGISREVYALTAGLTPLMPALDLNQLKRRPPPAEKVSWEWLPFMNSARKDNLQLYHWVRVVNGNQPTGDYAFAKYNKAWTKEETDQLFDLCERFDLSFIVIADRFPSSRTVEELKISKSILLARAPSPASVAGHPLLKETYNASQDSERKRALNLLLSHTKQQERRDLEVLAKAKKIVEARKLAKAAEEAQLLKISDVGNVGTDKVISAACTVSLPKSQIPSANNTNIEAEMASVMASLRTLRVYSRTYAFERMVQAVSSSAGLRIIKLVEQTLQDLGVNLKPKVPTKEVCAEHLELRKEIHTLLNLQKQLQYKEAEGSSYREAETLGTPPKLTRAADLDQTFTLDSLSNGGERFAKREQKRKGPGRSSEAPSSPAPSKRPRKYKASD